MQQGPLSLAPTLQFRLPTAFPVPLPPDRECVRGNVQYVRHPLVSV